jgi:nicotinamidase-related amidase
MSQVIKLHDRTRLPRSPTLVLVDLHDQGGSGDDINAQRSAALANCQAALSHARRIGMPVAFVRRVAESQLFNTEDRSPQWIKGFVPQRSEMVFDREFPSCYASHAFTERMMCVNSRFVLAGLFGEAACLSTVIDAYHRNHKVTYLIDASMSHAIDEITSSEMHQVVAGIISQYATVMETQRWVHLTSLVFEGQP